MSLPSILVIPHDPAWADRFADIRARLEVTLETVPILAIEHVGSTSVPGLAAKPVIDVDVVVRRDDVAAATSALVDAGYEHLGEMGITDRHAFRAPPGDIRQNTYVTVEGCLSLRNHLAVRDVLRADRELRDAYAACKWRLVAETDDIDEYVQGKSAVLQQVLRRAGLADAELAEIEVLNRA